MNASGVTRLLELFADDIDHIEYDVDGVTNTQSVFDTSIINNEITISFDVPTDDVGVIDNVTIVGLTQTYDTVDLTFDKTNDIGSVKIPYQISLA